MTDSSASAGRCAISLTVNGKLESIYAFPMQRLLDVLRNELRLTGTKEGCGEGECGSCAVLMNGDLVNSCLIPVLQTQHASITTIEGFADGSELNSLQKAFLECGGAQCGICTPGMLLSASFLLSKVSQPTLDEIREGLVGNLCRCTGYTQIFEAVAQVARQRAGG